MPDRYGDNRPGRDEPDDPPEPIDLDPEPEIDYHATAQRGLAQIRQAMGWK